MRENHSFLIRCRRGADGGDENAVGFFSSFIGWGVFRSHRKIHDLLIFLQISRLFEQIFSVSCFLIDTSLEHYNWKNRINLQTPMAPKIDTNCWWFTQKVDKLNGTSLPYNPTLNNPEKNVWIDNHPQRCLTCFLNAPAKRVTKSVDKIKIPLIKRFLNLLRKINLPRISIQFFRVNSSMKFVSWISRHLAWKMVHWQLRINCQFEVLLLVLTWKVFLETWGGFWEGCSQRMIHNLKFRKIITKVFLGEQFWELCCTEFHKLTCKLVGLWTTWTKSWLFFAEFRIFARVFR